MAQRFQKRLAKVFAGPWVLATSEDLRSPLTEGGRKPGTVDRLMYRYVDGVKKRIAQDPKALRTFVEVSHMLKPSTAMLRPGIVWGVLRQSRKRNPSSA